MKRALGIAAAVVAHLAVILFGGILFMKPPEEARKKVEIVDLLEDEKKEKDEDKKKEEVEPEKQDEEQAEEQMEAPSEMPDLRELAKIEAGPSAPALDAMSLSALEDVLNPSAGGAGSFSAGVSLASGGQIGGTGKGTMGEGGALQSIFSLSELDQKPRPLFQAAPSYPAEMRRRKIEGSVYVLFVVDEQGRVVNPRVEKSTQTEFERPALEAVKQWKFDPAVKAGKKVQCKMRVPLRFSVS